MPETVDLTERYHLLGTVANENEDDNSNLSPDNQRTEGNEVVLYTTNDKVEAESIRQAGGFISPDTEKWTVVTGYRDSERPKPLEK